MAKTTTPNRISVIIPTRSRADLLEKIIQCFERQTWKDKELLILDDTNGGSEKIEKLRQKHQQHKIWHTKNSLTIGEKRNQLIQESTGTIIAHFDDDDYYAPDYLKTLANEIIDGRNDFVKLTGWFCLHEASKTLGYWDTTRDDLEHYIFGGLKKIELRSEKFTKQAYSSFYRGYGFSYVYTKDIWERVKFESRNLGEDSSFFNNLIKERAKIKTIQDTSGLCLHIIHENNTSRSFPNHIIPNSLKDKYFPLKQSLKDVKIPAANKVHTSLCFYKTNKAWGAAAPQVTICTLTHNRKKCIRQLQKCIESQDYPLSKIEWLILDDSTEYTEPLEIKSLLPIKVKYQRLKTKLSLGKKRNIAHQLCSGDYIIYMDDDDYYYPARVSHAVSSLQKSGKEIAGSTLLQIYYCHDQQLWMSGPFGINHATAGTFAMTRKFAREHSYKDEDRCNEEKYFLNNYTIPMVQLDPLQTMICVSHTANTFDKKKMRRQGETTKMKKLNWQTQREIIKEFLGEY